MGVSFVVQRAWGGRVNVLGEERVGFFSVRRGWGGEGKRRVEEKVR